MVYYNSYIGSFSQFEKEVNSSGKSIKGKECGNAAQGAAKIAGSRQQTNDHGSVRSRDGRSYGSSCEAI